MRNKRKLRTSDLYYDIYIDSTNTNVHSHVKDKLNMTYLQNDNSVHINQYKVRRSDRYNTNCYNTYRQSVAEKGNYITTTINQQHVNDKICMMNTEHLDKRLISITHMHINALNRPLK